MVEYEHTFNAMIIIRWLSYHQTRNRINLNFRTLSTLFYNLNTIYYFYYHFQIPGELHKLILFTIQENNESSSIHDLSFFSLQSCTISSNLYFLFFSF